MLSYVLDSMTSGSETARWSDLATRRDLESESEDLSLSDSSLSEVLEHCGKAISQSVDIVI